MSDASYTVFETTLGHCGVAWRDRLVIGVELPGIDANATRQALLQRYPRSYERS